MKINDEFHRKAILLCVYELTGRGLDEVSRIFFFFNFMFYHLLRVQHRCSSTQSWGNVLPSIVAGFPRRLENRENKENENGQGKVREKSGSKQK